MHMYVLNDHIYKYMGLGFDCKSEKVTMKYFIDLIIIVSKSKDVEQNHTHVFPLWGADNYDLSSPLPFS